MNKQRPRQTGRGGFRRGAPPVHAKKLKLPALAAGPYAETVDGVIVVPPKEEADLPVRKTGFDKEKWRPKTGLGRMVKESQITDIDQILNKGLPIMEAEIVDALVPNLEGDLLFVGQAKGKFGGGKRRIFRQTQKKSKEGNKPKFGTYAIVGNHDGYVGLGHGKAKETVPSREKSARDAKINLIKITRGCGSWQCGCRQPHSIPFAVEGKVGSCFIRLMPAPKGSGLVVDKEIQKILSFAGIKDVYSITLGQTRSKINLASATIDALRKLSSTKVQEKYHKTLGIEKAELSSGGQ